MNDLKFAEELRKWWAFDDAQQHTHNWHSRESFIEDVLPVLLRSVRQEVIDALNIARSPQGR